MKLGVKSLIWRENADTGIRIHATDISTHQLLVIALAPKTHTSLCGALPQKTRNFILYYDGALSHLHHGLFHEEENTLFYFPLIKFLKGMLTLCSQCWQK